MTTECQPVDAAMLMLHAPLILREGSPALVKRQSVETWMKIYAAVSRRD
jgi:hypothetical protein